MKKLLAVVVLGVVIVGAHHAHAQVPVSPVPDQNLATIQTAFLSFLAVAIPAFLAYLTVQIQAWQARSRADSQRAQVHAAADTGAKQVFATAAPTSNIETKAIDPGGIEVRQVAAWVKGPGAGDAVKALGLSDADVAGKALGALGGQQIAAASSAPSTVIAPLAQPSTMDVSVAGNATVGAKTKG